MLSKTTTRKQIEQSIGLLGATKRYQFLQGMIMTLCWVVITLLINNGFFIFMNPVFKCDGDIREEKEACGMLAQCEITNKFTATSYSGLVCENQNLRSTVQSAFYIGNLLALITFAPLSDSKGRRSTSLVITFLLIVSQILMYTGVHNSIWPFLIISQLINGVFVAGMSINTYVFTTEFCTDVQKQKYIMVYWVGGSFADILIFLFYYLLPEWYYDVIFGVGIPAIILFVAQYFVVLETPHFLLFLEKDLGKFDKCIDSLAKYNDCTGEEVANIKTLARTFYQQHELTQKKQDKIAQIPFFHSVKQLFQNRQYLWIALRLSICKIGVNAFVFAMTYCFDRLGYNFGLSMLFFGINQCLSSLVASILLETAPKKPTLIISVLVSSLFGFCYFLPFVNGNSALETAVIFLATISLMFAFIALGLMSVQYFPTQISSTSIGIIDCVSYTINVFMPFFVNWMHDSHANPVAGISFLLLVAGIGPLIGLKNVVENPREDLSDIQRQSSIQ